MNKLTVKQTEALAHFATPSRDYDSRTKRSIVHGGVVRSLLKQGLIKCVGMENPNTFSPLYVVA